MAEDGVARRIIAAIKEQIHNGTYRSGDKLPSTRALAIEWGASRTTMTVAYGQLIAEGYIISRAGARAVVAEGVVEPKPVIDIPERALRLSEFAQRLLSFPAAQEPRTIRLADFRYGDMAARDFPDLAWQRALKAANRRHTTQLRYGDPQGSLALREAIGKYLWRARGIGCSPYDVVIVNGSQQGLDLCARILMDAGERFIMENPGYVLARHAFQAAGGVPIPISVDAEGLVTNALPPARLAYVTPSHQYPIGAVMSVARRRSLIAWAADVGAFIVEDDYDGEYRHDIAPIKPVQTLAPNSVIYVGTFSKTLSPALRLGYLVVPPALRQAFREAKRLTDRHTPILEQDALTDLIETGAYERHVRVIRRKNAERRTLLLRVISKELGASATIVGADTGLHLVMWIHGIAAKQERKLVAAAQSAGLGLYPVSALCDPATPAATTLGFVFGYAALSDEALRRGIRIFASVLTDFR